MIASLLANKGDVMRAVDSFFESGGEMPKDGAKEELWAYWQEFCKRNVAVTMVLDPLLTPSSRGAQPVG